MYKNTVKHLVHLGIIQFSHFSRVWCKRKEQILKRFAKWVGGTILEKTKQTYFISDIVDNNNGWGTMNEIGTIGPELKTNKKKKAWEKRTSINSQILNE